MTTTTKCIRCRRTIEELKSVHNNNHVTYTSSCGACGIHYELICTPLRQT